MMSGYERALTERALERIEAQFCRGTAGDYEVGRLITSCHIYRRVLKELFHKFQSEPLRRISVSDPVRNSELAYLKELVSMEDAQ